MSVEVDGEEFVFDHVLEISRPPDKKQEARTIRFDANDSTRAQEATAKEARVSFKIEKGAEVFITHEGLKTAVGEWLRKPQDAQLKYGHINCWDTSNVTDFSFLFAHAKDFNEDISRWSTGQVTSMKCALCTRNPSMETLDDGVLQGAAICRICSTTRCNFKET